MWGKHTNFEQATRSPLIFAAPGMKPGKSESLSHHIDIFPTLCSLSGIPIPTQLDGKSLMPIMQNNKAKLYDFAVSQYPRKLKADEVKKLGYANGKLMGYSIRTKQYRYTLWMNNNFTSKEPYSASRVYAAELYDYVKDPLEKVNVASVKEYAKVSKELNETMVKFFKSQVKK
jgi:arylsulfatase A-like enzyme